MSPLARLLEAALFSASRPLAVDELRALDRDATPAAVREALGELRFEFEDDRHGVELVEIGGGYQLITRREYAEIIERAQIVQRPRKLSNAALETLAIVAYRQPVERAEVEEIRGVSSEGVLRSLVERGLLDISGRGEGLGRPVLYQTTPLFLEYLGLADLSQLPRAEELTVLLKPLALTVDEEAEGDRTAEAAAGS